MIWAEALDAYHRYYGFNLCETLRRARETVRLSAEFVWMLIEKEHLGLSKTPFCRWEHVRDCLLRIYAPEYRRRRRRDEERAQKDRWEKFLAQHRRELEARHRRKDGEVMDDIEDSLGHLGEVIKTIISEPDDGGEELDTSDVVDTSGDFVILDSEGGNDDDIEATTQHPEIEPVAPLVSTILDEEYTLADVTCDITITPVVEEVLASVVHIEMVLPIAVTPDIAEIFGEITSVWHDGPLYHSHVQ
ncbi:uncharacterized protein LOC143883687 [Tasmannia lanceolata]|uniref:uncharacterized protein LOC143883687 n=1 Tax=Tasmannia lanceolata TaxID=3420 RepID=UPI0040644C53